MKILFYLTALMVPFWAYGTEDKYNFGCWDGTFAYNKFMASEVENGYEISFKGATLGAIELVDANGVVLDTLKGGWNEAEMHTKFTLDQCTKTGTNLECSRIQTANQFTRHLFIKRVVNDLDDRLEVITPIPTSKITFAVGDEMATLTIIGRFSSDSKPQTATVMFSRFDDSLGYCGQQYRVNFPQRLRDFLTMVENNN